jgi:hypothetical protein
VGDQGLAGCCLVAGGDGVLEVENHRIRTFRGLGITIGAVCRAEQQGGAEVECHFSILSHQTSVVRTAVATIASRWLRPT